MIRRELGRSMPSGAPQQPSPSSTTPTTSSVTRPSGRRRTSTRNGPSPSTPNWAGTLTLPDRSPKIHPTTRLPSQPSFSSPWRLWAVCGRRRLCFRPFRCSRASWGLSSCTSNRKPDYKTFKLIIYLFFLKFKSNCIPEPIIKDPSQGFHLPCQDALFGQ